MTCNLLVHIFVVGFGLNLLWELAHHRLYETCRRQTWRKNVPLLIVMSAKDGFWIALFSIISSLVFGIENILQHGGALAFFVALALAFSFFDERISLRLGRWEYAAGMPTLFGVGVTPLLEIALTGVATLLLVF